MVDIHYLKLLSRQYPTCEAAAAEIMRLYSSLHMPKGTEYFFSDLHGEYDAFIHQLKSVSGVIKSKIDELFSCSLSEDDRKKLASLIYYPEREISKQVDADGFEEWVKLTISRLTRICICVSEKCTRAQIRRKAPKDFSEITDELIHASETGKDKYFTAIVESVIHTGMSREFITGLCQMIRDIAIDRLHILGDIFDRGPHAELIMKELMQFHDLDIQWGNHDIAWIGAACGNLACTASVLRIGISYNNFDLLEYGYGINLRPLSMFAEKIYHNDECEYFMPHILDENKYDRVPPALAAKMHKAIAVIQFKLEGQLYEEHPEYNMADRMLLKNIDFEKGTVAVDGTVYKLRDTNLPTVNPQNPLELTAEEEELIYVLSTSFIKSSRLQKHIRFLFEKGGMYKSVNGNLLFHGCIPMTESGEFDVIELDNEKLCGKSYLDYIQQKVINAFFSSHDPKKRNADRDFLWYLWCGAKSPLFGKSKSGAFEGYFIEDSEAKREFMNPYYRLVEDKNICCKILTEFGLDPENSHIINGHLPVKQGDNPVKGDGSLFMIDGGISKAYQKKTGISGYTFIFSSKYLALVKHSPLELTDSDESPEIQITKYVKNRLYAKDTEMGKETQQRIEELYALLNAFRSGILKEENNE